MVVIFIDLYGERYTGHAQDLSRASLDPGVAAGLFVGAGLFLR
jgi:hypothetical protein